MKINLRILNNYKDNFKTFLIIKKISLNITIYIDMFPESK